MLAILLFFLDLLAYVYCEQWVFLSLLCYFIYKLVAADFSYKFMSFWLPLGLLLVQSSLITGRFGLSLVYLLPMILIAARCRGILLNSSSILPFIFILTALLAENVGFKLLLGLPMGTFFVTIMKIFVNVGIESLILLGTRGNRCLPFYGKGRKVWTPSRMNAS